MHILTSSEKKKITETLHEQFGINQLPYQLLQFGKERLRLFSGNLSREQLFLLDKNVRIENVGLYSMREDFGDIRLTIDGVHFLKNQIRKNIVELSEEQTKKWMKGEDIEIQAERGFMIIKNKDYVLGCGKSTGEKIINSVPKERRMK